MFFLREGVKSMMFRCFHIFHALSNFRMCSEFWVFAPYQFLQGEIPQKIEMFVAIKNGWCSAAIVGWFGILLRTVTTVEALLNQNQRAMCVPKLWHCHIVKMRISNSLVSVFDWRLGVVSKTTIFSQKLLKQKNRETLLFPGSRWYMI